MEQHEGLGNLFTKLAKISGELGAIPKSAKHQQGYMYQSADDVMSSLNPLLASHNIVIVPMATKTRLETPADGISRYVIDYEFVICDGDTGETFVAAWQGDIPTGYAGNKVDDKAMGKAHTYALKYWLLKLFKVTSQDDADLDRNNHTYSNQKPETTQKTSQPSNVTTIPTQKKQAQSDTSESHFTEATTTVVTKISTGKKPYHVIAGISTWERKPLRALGYTDAWLNDDPKAGVTELSDPVIIEWATDANGYKIPLFYKRVKTGEIVDKDGNVIEQAS
jgi:hypothetical protein